MHLLSTKINYVRINRNDAEEESKLNCRQKKNIKEIIVVNINKYKIE